MVLEITETPFLVGGGVGFLFNDYFRDCRKSFFILIN